MSILNLYFILFYWISPINKMQKPWSDCLWEYIALVDRLIDWLIDWQVMKAAGVNQAGLFWETSFEDILKVRQFVTQEWKKKNL